MMKYWKNIKKLGAKNGTGDNHEYEKIKNGMDETKLYEKDKFSLNYSRK